MTAPVAQELPSVSPSRLQSLRDCFLQVAFAQAAHGQGARSDAQLVGEAAHEALDWLVSGGPPFDRRQAALSDYFTARLAERAPGRDVAGARPARARIRKIAARAVALVEGAGVDASVRTERRLVGKSGLLVGIIDLAVASTEVHVIVDYKTGRPVDEDGELSRHIQEQLAIYCILEHEATGAWPQQAFVFGFRSSPIEWAVEPAVCEDVGSAALALREQYDAHRGSTPPASPTPPACRYCSFAPRCDAFWAAVDHDWSASVQGVRGRIKWGKRTSAGDITLALTDCEGTATGETVVRQVPADLLSNDALREGTVVALVGLWTDREGRLVAGRSVRSWTG